MGNILDVLEPQEQAWECDRREFNYAELKWLFDKPFVPLLRRTNDLYGTSEDSVVQVSPSRSVALS